MLILKEPTLDEQGYAIDADEFNVILYKLTINKTGKNIGSVNRLAVSYCTYIEQCLKKVYQLEVGLVGFSDLEALEERVIRTINTCVESLGKWNRVRGEV